MKTSKSIYLHVYEEQRDVLPLYASPWWLDAVCGPDGWDVVMDHTAGDSPAVSLPYHRTRIRGMAAVITPPLTQWVQIAGPVANKPQIITGLLDQLPSSAILDLAVRAGGDTRIEGGKYSVQLQYSYLLQPGAIEDIRSGYNEGLKRNLRQAAGLYTIHPCMDPGILLALCKNSHAQRGMKVPHWMDRVLPLVYHALMEKGCGEMTVVKAGDKIIAGMMGGWDSGMTYYLAGGRDGGEEGAAAHALLLDHAIAGACRRGQGFDFEGSMHPGIANFFQSFGAVPVSFVRIRRYRGLGRLWKILK